MSHIVEVEKMYLAGVKLERIRHKTYRGKRNSSGPLPVYKWMQWSVFVLEDLMS